MVQVYRRNTEGLDIVGERNPEKRIPNTLTTAGKHQSRKPSPLKSNGVTLRNGATSNRAKPAFVVVSIVKKSPPTKTLFAPPSISARTLQISTTRQEQEIDRTIRGQTTKPSERSSNRKVISRRRSRTIRSDHTARYDVASCRRTKVGGVKLLSAEPSSPPMNSYRIAAKPVIRNLPSSVSQYRRQLRPMRLKV